MSVVMVFNSITILILETHLRATPEGWKAELILV